jgi:methyl-accepting chemotaxis protein
MKVNLKKKILLTALIPLVLVTTALGLSTVWTVQKKVLTTAQEKLKGDLATARALLNEKYPGEWSLRNGKLYKGEAQMNDNFTFVDAVGFYTGDTVTIFQGDTRVSTNVKTAAGARAVGTKAAENVVESVLKRGQPYLGKADVVGVTNQTAYEPIKTSGGEIIGMLYVGVPNTQYEGVIRDITFQIVALSMGGVFIVLILGLWVARSISRPINRIIEGLNDAAEQMASGSTQVASASQSLAEGASEQAAGLEETSASIEEMASMTKNNAQNAGQANTLMIDTGKVVEGANQAMGELNKSMNEISLASEETSKIIKTIDEIAFQTNLLALNAAVEAARAGEAGAGFAVVADEVRNLAMRAAEAAKNTANLIEGTVKKVKNGSEIVTRTNEAFVKVVQGAKKVEGLVAEISAASQEQAQGVTQINKAMAEMDKVTQQNAADAEESAAAAQEMSAQAEQMRAYVQEMNALVKGKSNGTSAAAGFHLAEEKRSPNPGKTQQLKNGLKKMLKSPESKGEQGKKPVKAVVKEVKPSQVIPLEEGDFKEF